MTSTLEHPQASQKKSEAIASAIVGDAPELASVREVASAIAGRKCTVLVLGETGTGKEMLARHIHENSDRAAKPFIPVDCSSLTDTLFESQLFGHTKGAFTGAVRDSLGFIRAADGGTLFLDEIGELSLPLQAKLLRVIQERAVVPVGDTKAKPVDVRIVCATHRNLREMVANGTFREDLYFRLNVVTLNLPPLRDRADDVVTLAQHFLDLQSALYNEPARTLNDDARAALLAHNWPGNVRELANAMESAYVLASGSSIELADLPDRIRMTSPASRPTARVATPASMAKVTSLIAAELSGNEIPVCSDDELDLDKVERRTIAEALRRTKNNKAAAARMLGLNIQRLNRKIEKLEIGLQ
jgi:transcriptional regulator with PAS, ATPase and Fis domain